MFKAAIFDLDGTLIDSYGLILNAFIEALASIGESYSTEDVYALFGPPEEVIFMRLDPDNKHNLLEKYLKLYTAKHQDYCKLYPGIKELLDWLEEKNIARAIITGKGFATTCITLKELGIEHHFQSIVTGCCVNKYKPDPEGMHKVLACLNVQPQQAFYLGDSPVDIIAANAADVTALAALWGTHDQGPLLDLAPHRAFANPGELMAWLQEQL